MMTAKNIAKALRNVVEQWDGKAPDDCLEYQAADMLDYQQARIHKMKNIFVELTEVDVDTTGAVKTSSCWVNMSRVQEMRLGNVDTASVGRVQVTLLTMNIPDYVVVVDEHPEVILQRLAKVNEEKFELCDD